MSEKQAQTCDVCKVRHQKCDSVRPTCYHCKIRDLACVYSSISAKSRGSGATSSSATSSRSKQTVSTLNNTSSDGTSRSSVEATGLPKPSNGELTIRKVLKAELVNTGLSAKQTEALVDSLSRKVALRTNSSIDCPTDLKPAPLRSATTDHLISLLAHTLSRVSGQFPTTITASLPTAKDPSHVLIWMPAATEYSMAPIHTSEFPPSSEANSWLETFLNGPNNLISIVKQNECQVLFDRFYHSHESLTHRETCLFTHLLAAGSRFTADVPPDVYLHWSHRARSQFEYCVNENRGSQLWVLQPLLLSCLISIHTSPGTCWLALGTIIRIAQSYRIDQDCSGDEMPEGEYKKWRRLWQTIIFFDVWLAVSLGRAPQVNEHTTSDPLIRDISAYVNVPEHSLEGNVARLSVILGNVLRDLHMTEQSDLSIYERHTQILETWASTLPSTLRFRGDGLRHTSAAPAMDTKSDVTSSYLELIYLYTLMILTQPLVCQRAASTMGGASQLPSNVWFLAQTCADSAIQLGQISLKMAKHGIICKRSWLVPIVNYHGALILLLTLSTKEPDVRYSVPTVEQQSHRNMAHTGLSTSHQILAFCAQQDAHAQHLTEVLRFLRARLESIESASPHDEYANLSPIDADSEMRDFATGPSADALGQQPPMGVNTSLITHPSYEDPARGSEAEARWSAGSQGYEGFVSPTGAQPADHAASRGVPQLAGQYDPQLAYYQWRYQSMAGLVPDNPTREQGGHGMRGRGDGE